MFAIHVDATRSLSPTREIFFKVISSPQRFPNVAFPFIARKVVPTISSCSNWITLSPVLFSFFLSFLVLIVASCSASRVTLSRSRVFKVHALLHLLLGIREQIFYKRNTTVFPSTRFVSVSPIYPPLPSISFDIPKNETSQESMTAIRSKLGSAQQSNPFGFPFTAD